MSALADVQPGGWIVQLTCCGRDNGIFAAATWAEADQFREDYLSGPGVAQSGDPSFMGGHRRSAIIVAGYGRGSR